MAAMVLLNEFVSINGVDMTSYAMKAAVAVDVADVDKSTFVSAGWKEVLGGIKTGTLEIELVDDFAAGAVNQQLWALIGTVVPFEVRPTAGAVSTSNPKFTGNVLVKSMLTGGKIGELAQTSATWPTSGPVTRATA